MSTDPASRALSANGLRMIQRFEGCRLTVYLDSKGKPTVGVGHLLVGAYKPGLVWTFEEAMAQLALDARGVVDAINANVKVQLSQQQFDALSSLTFNIGIGAFGGSTLLKALNKGEYAAAGNQFLAWSKDKELLPRRQAEKAVWDYGTI